MHGLKRTQVTRLTSALAALGFLAYAGSANAVSTVYAIDTSLSSATVDLFLLDTAGGQTAMGVAAPLNILGNSITFDNAGNGTLVDFSISANGTLNLAAGAVSSVDIVNAVISATGPQTTQAGSSCSAAGCTTFTTGSVDVNALVSLDGSPAYPIGSTQGMTTTVNTNGQLQLSLLGITIGAFPELDAQGVPTGNMVAVKADLLLVANAIPEPTGVVLMGLGGLLLAHRTGRRNWALN